MTDPQRDQWCRFASELANDARVIAARYRNHMAVSSKMDRSVVTEADHQIQRHMCAAIRDRFPTHAVICEETADYLAQMPSPNEAGFCWVIDPLDGTRNYVRGIPCCCTSIALLEHGQPIVGVIGDMNTPDLYTAIAGQGARLNESILSTAPAHEMGKPVVSFQSPRRGERVDHLPPWTRGVRMRNLGSTAMHLAYVASGALDGAVCLDCRIWDIAAGYLLVVESGGRMTCENGSPLFPLDVHGKLTREMTLVAACPTLHDQLIQPSTNTPSHTGKLTGA